MIIGSKELKNISESEFPKGEVKNTNIDIFFALQKQRDIFGTLIRPSPAPGALARYKEGSKTSCHYSDETKKSIACDWFPGKEISMHRVYFDVVCSGLWGGIGFYFDGHGFKDTHNIRIHTDLRPKGNGHTRETSLIWFVKDGKRQYPQYDNFSAIKFFDLLKGLRNGDYKKD